jgi:hypothetical protein
MADRYVPVFFLRNEDDRRRWFIVDLEPSETARAGTVIAELHSERHATQLAAALNRQPATPEVSPWVAPFLQPPLATVPDDDGSDAF